MLFYQRQDTVKGTGYFVLDREEHEDQRSSSAQGGATQSEEEEEEEDLNDNENDEEEEPEPNHDVTMNTNWGIGKETDGTWKAISTQSSAGGPGLVATRHRAVWGDPHTHTALEYLKQLEPSSVVRLRAGSLENGKKKTTKK